MGMGKHGKAWVLTAGRDLLHDHPNLEHVLGIVIVKHQVLGPGAVVVAAAAAVAVAVVVAAAAAAAVVCGVDSTDRRIVRSSFRERAMGDDHIAQRLVVASHYGQRVNEQSV